MSDSDESEAPDALIRCGTHGLVTRALICGHLFAHRLHRDAEPLTYYFGNDVDSGPESTDTTCAWCSACDAMLEREGDWNDVSEAFADIHVICEFCLRSILDRNTAGT